jgi:hypothetical protein
VPVSPNASDGNNHEINLEHDEAHEGVGEGG